MLIELSPSKRFCLSLGKQQPPTYSISDNELKKAKVQHSIGIVEPRVNVSKVRIKLGIKVVIATRLFLNSKTMQLYKDDQGFYLKEIDW